MGAKAGTKSPSRIIAGKKKVAKPSKTAKFAKTELDSALVSKAVNAVLKYHEKVTDGSSGKLTLLGNDRPVQVQLTLLRAPGKSQPKPAQLVVPHPFYKLADTSDNDSDDIEEPEICLIVKDESKPWCLAMIEKFPDHMGCVKKVLTLESLRKKHQSYEQKRQLLSKYNMFMADDRILPMMSKALGNVFIKAKKLPIPIDLTRETALPFVVQRALRATYMTVNTGTCISIRAGHTGMETNKLVANVIAIAKAAATKIPHSWANIQMIGVKTADSVSLPIYNKTPEALREIAKLSGINSNAGVPGDDNKAEDGETSETDRKDAREKRKEVKSPLLQALKKQKKAKEEKDSSEKTKDETTKKEKQDKKKATEKKAKRSPSPQPDSNIKKKQKNEEPVQEKEKKDFFSSNKFKGSMKGYYFRMGKKGLGYYIDKKPVIDKMKVDAILRMATGRGQGTKKKNKQRGRRR